MLGRQKILSELQEASKQINVDDHEWWLWAQDQIKEEVLILEEREMKAISEVLWNDIAEWSQKTFGNDDERGPKGPLNHLRKECLEAIADPTDIMEFADCLILLDDAARRAGFTNEQLHKAALVKVQINRSRTYLKPTGDDISEHVRELGIGQGD
jgi:hypothetical protein